jgi:hypothetical protein
MFVQLGRKRGKWLVGAASVAIVAGVVFAPLAFARIAQNTIDDVAIVSHNGRHLLVSGPLSCDQNQRVVMRVTVTQRTTGAVAEGYTTFIGTVAEQQWEVHATTLGIRGFQPGPATVVALARSAGAPGRPDDAHQWLVNVTLVEE